MGFYELSNLYSFLLWQTLFSKFKLQPLPKENVLCIPVSQDRGTQKKHRQKQTADIHMLNVGDY